MKNLFIIGLTAILAAVVSFTVACQSNGKENEDGSRVTQTGNGEEENVGDFILTISVEKTTLTAGELNYKSFQVYPELKNLSGRDLEITVDILFWPRIPGWRSNESIMDMPMARTILFPKNGIIRCEPYTHGSLYGEPIAFGVGAEEGNNLSVGTHKLNFGAGFILEGQRIGVDSNTVILTVLP